MVRDFGITDDDRMISYYAGLISASFAIGAFLSGVPWGILSDRVGRKPVLIFGLFGTMMAMFLFGLSKSLPWAMTTRFMAGILNGNIGVLKSMVGEMTDRSNRAKAFNYVSMVFGLGLIIGPALGGFLVYPVDNFPSLFGNSNFFKEYPFFLPCFVSSALCAISLVFGLFYLEETSSISDSTLSVTTPLLVSDSAVSSVILPYDIPSEDQVGSIESAPNVMQDTVHQKDTCEISKGTWLLIQSFMGMSLIDTIIEELFPFWAATHISDGGLDYQASDIGLLNSMMGVVLVAMQLGLYNKLQRKFSALTLLRWSFLLYVPLFLMMPTVKIFRDRNQPILAWAVLVGMYVIRTFCDMLAFTSFNILLPESCESKQVLGKINGISQALSSLMRGIGPYLCGLFWSWSLSNGLSFPFDYHFTFISISAMSFLTYLIVSRVRSDMVSY
ncbi:hypothetical protein DSO57_1010758 [Entomophthora muscae]|nr:hypothetical protein DSO57_1010758 [Entomophthora muscae]